MKCGNKLLWVIIVLLIVNIAISLFNKDSPTHTIEKQIDSIKLINDTIISKIDSSKHTVYKINNWYEKETKTILNQSVDSDMLYFSKYLSTETK